MSQFGPMMGRRSLLKAGGAALALGSLGSLAACSSAGSSGTASAAQEK